VAQLGNAEWELAQTNVRAPADGYVTLSALTVGDRVAPTRSAMSFLLGTIWSCSASFRKTG
jgi:multidrug resistance efflux pump